MTPSRIKHICQDMVTWIIFVLVMVHTGAKLEWFHWPIIAALVIFYVWISLRRVVFVIEVELNDKEDAND